jgi:hypothetical protein
MKSIRTLLTGAFLSATFIVSLHLLRAQETASPDGTVSLTGTNLDWNSLSDAQIELMAVEQVPPIPYAQSPNLPGTYWSAQHSPVSPAPWPPFPGNIQQLPIWNLGTNNVGSGVFLLDDIGVNYGSTATDSSTKAGGMQPMEEDDGPPPPPGGTNSGGGGTPLIGGAEPFDTNGLWLSLDSVSNGQTLYGQAFLTIHNTTNDIEYQLLSRESVGTDGVWQPEGSPVLGSAMSNWTPVVEDQNGRSNLFYEVQSQADSTGTGIPDWWWLKYFGTTNDMDAYADSDGDGWNNIEEYQNGTDPTNFDAPPVVQGIYVRSDGSGNDVISWNPPEVTPSSFTIQQNTGSDWQTIATVAGNITSFTVTNPPAGVSYQISANYLNGSSDYVAAESPSDFDPALTLPATVAAGPDGRLFLLTAMLSSILSDINNCV